MNDAKILLSALFCLNIILVCEIEAAEKPEKTVMLVLLISNEGHTLYPFLDSLEKLSYPKKLIDLYIRSDHNEDSTYYILEYWLAKHGNKYNSVDKITKFDELLYPDENEEKMWNDMRSIALMELKEDALMKAREREKDYVWFLDADVFIHNSLILQKLMKEEKTVIAPKLDSVTMFSNFWGEMSEDYWYQRSDGYGDIINNEKIGCFPVALINSCVLVNLKDEKSKALTFMKHKIPHHSSSRIIPRNDAIIFAVSAQTNKIDQFICNKEDYGTILLSEQPNQANEFQQLKELGVIDVQKTINKNENISALSKEELSSKINSAFDKIYCMNMRRRTDRRKDMILKFQQLGLNVSYFDAYDWRDFNASFLRDIGLRQLKSYHGDDMTYGLVGNFLSHYFIWEDIIKNDFQQVLMFEDDVNFHDDFLEKTAKLLDEVETLDLEWELVYPGRKILRSWEETPVSGSDILLKPSYTYWTLGYMLSYAGAKKLLDQKPLQKILPIDEYLPIMFDMHPETQWSEHFYPRDLKAFAITPVICEPQYYLNEHQNYTSDTTTSPQLSEVLDFETDPRLHANQNFGFCKVGL